MEETETAMETTAEAGGTPESPESALQAREREVTARELRLRAREALRERGLPEGLSDALELSSDEGLTRSLAAVEAAFRASVESAVRQRLGGAPPKAVGGSAPRSAGLAGAVAEKYGRK